jgi:hypothetical protein
MSENKTDQKSQWWMEMDHQADLENLQGYRETKELLQEHDEIAMRLPENDDFFEQMHNRIMAGVEKTSVQKDSKPWRLRYQRWIRGSVAAVALLALTLAGVETQQSKIGPDQTEIVLQDVVDQSPDIDSTIMVYQSKDDFFVDLAQESLNHLTVDHLQGLVRAAQD